jgi:hypothetical protein
MFGQLRKNKPETNIRPTPHITEGKEDIVLHNITDPIGEVRAAIRVHNEKFIKLKTQINKTCHWDYFKIGDNPSPNIILREDKIKDQMVREDFESDIHWCEYLYDEMFRDKSKDGFRRCLIEGVSGTGKTYFANQMINALESRGFKVAKAAFTHTASKLIEGVTLHSLLGISVNGNTNASSINNISDKYDALVIDEVSFIPVEVWRVLQHLPDDFRIYCFGDFEQLVPINAGFDLQTSQAVMNVCGNIRIRLTRQWRSNPQYVHECLQHSKNFNPHNLPAGVNNGTKLTMSQLVKMDKHIFVNNRPRAKLNTQIVSFNAHEEKGAIFFSSNERVIVHGNKQIHYEYADIPRLAVILRDGVDDADSLMIRKYLARARFHNGQWRVGVSYTCPNDDRMFADTGLQKFPRWLRALVAPKYVDVDFSNCGYFIIRELMKKMKLPYDAINEYIENRDVHLKEATLFNPKKQFISVLNGGKAASYHLLRAIEIEIKALHDKLAKTEQYKEWVKCRVKKEQVKNKLIREQDVEKRLNMLETNSLPETFESAFRRLNYNRAILTGEYIKSYVSHLIYKKEAMLLSLLIKSVRNQTDKSIPVVPIFDGAMFYGIDKESLDLDQIGKDIFNVTGYPMKVSIKPVHDNDEYINRAFHGLSPAELEGTGDITYDEYPAVYPGLPCIMTSTIGQDQDKLVNNEEITFLKREIKNQRSYFIFTRKDSDAEICVDEAHARRYSRPSFCITDYKSQGTTIHGTVCIHQYFDKNNSQNSMSSNSRYVSLTRATNASNVYVR